MKDAALEAYCNGESVTSIAKRLGTSTGNVYRWARAAGVFVYRRMGPPATVSREAVLAMRAQGASLAEIAKHFGFTRQRAQQICASPEPRAGRTNAATGPAVRCSKEHMEALDAWRAHHGWSRPEALHALIEGIKGE